MPHATLFLILKLGATVLSVGHMLDDNERAGFNHALWRMLNFRRRLRFESQFHGGSCMYLTSRSRLIGVMTAMCLYQWRVVETKNRYSMSEIE